MLALKVYFGQKNDLLFDICTVAKRVVTYIIALLPKDLPESFALLPKIYLNNLHCCQMNYLNHLHCCQINYLNHLHCCQTCSCQFFIFIQNKSPHRVHVHVNLKKWNKIFDLRKKNYCAIMWPLFIGLQYLNYIWFKTIIILNIFMIFFMWTSHSDLFWSLSIICISDLRHLSFTSFACQCTPLNDSWHPNANQLLGKISFFAISYFLSPWYFPQELTSFWVSVGIWK